MKDPPGTGHEGDETAQKAESSRLDAATLFRHHAPFVAGFLGRMGIPAPDVDDLVQEVFVIAHRRGGYQAGPAKPTTWLAEIAVRVASTHRRGRGRSRTEANEAAVARAVAGAPTPADAAETAESLARVDRALGSLDVERRAVFILFEIEGQSCDEIAAGLAVPVGTVHSRLHKARKEFTAAWQRLASREVPS